MCVFESYICISSLQLEVFFLSILIENCCWIEIRVYEEAKWDMKLICNWNFSFIIFLIIISSSSSSASSSASTSSSSSSFTSPPSTSSTSVFFVRRLRFYQNKQMSFFLIFYFIFFSLHFLIIVCEKLSKAIKKINFLQTMKLKWKNKYTNTIFRN